MSATVRAHGRRRERGFNLVELMIATCIGGCLMTLVLGTVGRMSIAFNGSTRVAQVGQTLQASREVIGRSVRQAGFRLPDGFRTAALGDPDTSVATLQVLNDRDGTGMDGLRVFHADASFEASVTQLDVTATRATLTTVNGLQVGEVVVLVNPRLVTTPGVDAPVARYDACVVQVTAIDAVARTVDFSAAGGAPYNIASNPQCDEVRARTDDGSGTGDGETMLYRFAARAYRIDPTRLEQAVLQVSLSGELVAGDWQDFGVGFVNLQVATRYFEDGDAADLDGDGDAERDWYSAEAQESPDPTATRPANAVPVTLSLSLEARSLDQLPGAVAATSGHFTDSSNPSHNRLGDWAAVVLPGSEPYRAGHVYRWTTSLVDLRNLGVGR